MPNDRGRYWCFTLNNYTSDELDQCNKVHERCEDVTYFAYGKEKGDKGTPHLQGYIEFSNKIRLGGIKRIDGLKRCHLELRMGTAKQATDYCRKEGDFVDFGTMSQSRQGKRTDLDSIKEYLDAGEPEEKIAGEFFGSWCRYRKSFHAYKSIISKKTARDVEVFVIWGEPGTGKTRIIFETFPDVWISNDPTLKWFDGYAGEETVLIDDYRGDGNSAFMLRLLDRYPLQVPVKGGFVPWNARRIFITSNVPPPFGHNDIAAAFRRRIRRVVMLSQPLNFEKDEEIKAVKDLFN